MTFKKQLANILTGARIAGAIVLLFLGTFSTAFYAVYFFCGVTDMLDGPLARITHSESRAGATLDSVADLVFVGVCLYKLYPALLLPQWVSVWVAVIILIKLVNLVLGLVCRRKTFFLHTTANRITGLLLFLAAPALIFIPIEYTAAVICACATFAAVQEGHLIRTMR